MALISIAHPKFRSWLLAEAKQRRLVYVNQLEPPVRVSLYPKELETKTRTKDGLRLLIRPIKTTDEDLLRDLFYRFSSETIYQRFFAIKKYPPHATLQQFCTIDYDRDMTLVASLAQGDVEQIVGTAMFAVDPRTGFAEAAFVVADQFQGRAIGSTLMRRLTEIAMARGVKGFTADVLADNTRMLHVFEKCGFKIEATAHGDTLQLRIEFRHQAHEPTRSYAMIGDWTHV